MTANTNDLNVFRWDITNGTVATNPVLVKLDGVFPIHATPRIHYGPVIYPVDANSFILNSARMHPTLYNMSGTSLNTFNGTAQPGMAGISGLTHFNFKGRSFVLCGSTSHQTAGNPLPLNTFKAFEIMGTEFNFTGAVSLEQLPAAGFGGSATVSPNTTYQMPMAYKVLANEVQFFVMVPNVGFAGYKFTIGTPTSVVNPEASGDVTVYPIPAIDVVNFSAKMATIELYNLAGQIVRKGFDTNKINVNGLQGAYIVKAVDSQGKIIKRKVTVK